MTASVELTLPPDIVLPTTREEAWRYTPVDEIVARLQAATAAVDSPVPAIDRALVDRVAGVPRVVIVNGAIAHEISDLDRLPAGVAIQVHDSAGPEPAPAVRDDGFQALNRAGGGIAVVIEVAPDTQVDGPIHVVHLAVDGAFGSDGALLRQPRTTVHARSGSKVTVAETFCGTGVGVTNACTTIHAEADAAVRYLRVQDEAAASTHVGHTRVIEDEAADVQLLSVMLGADIARHAIDAELRGPRARVQLDGVTVPAGTQRHDHVVTVEHAASHGLSRQRFRAVVDGHARSSFSGHVVVPQGTRGTDADQSSRNVLLTRTAEADSRPWLEIFSDDVRCTHGATVGRLDDEALFYLQSRGIPRAEARRMLIAAFVQDVVESIEDESLRERIATLVESRVGSADGTGGPAR